MGNKRLSKRRDFLKQIAAAGAMTVGAPALVNAMPSAPSYENKEGHTFLFQGDSITDGNRSRDNDWNHVMGHGYAYLIASRLGYDLPKKNFKFFNRGVSGDKVTDLAARWQNDALQLKPDLLSILVGINDIAVFIDGDDRYNTAQYKHAYRELLQQAKQQIPNIQLVLCEPFVLPVGRVKDKWTVYSGEVEKRRKIVKELSAEFDAVFVEFQSAFDKALAKAPADHWIWDGIHPMPAGHELMAREWIQQVSKKIRWIKN